MNLLNKLLRLVGLDKGLVSVAGASFISSITGAVFWLFIATLMMKEGYGQVNYLMSIAFLFSGFSLLGLGTAVTTFIPKGEEIVRYQANSLVLFSNVIIFVLLLIFTTNLVVVILLLGVSFYNMSLAYYLGQRNYKKYSFTVVIQRLLNFPLALGLYFIIGINGIVLGFAISSLIFSYSFFNSLKGLKFQFGFLRTKLPFVMHSYYYELSIDITRNADKLLIAPVFGFGMLGLYQMGFQFLTFLSIIPSSVGQFLLPQEAAGIKQKQVVLKAVFIAIIVSIVSFLTIPIIIKTLFPHFIESIQISQIMVFSIIPMTGSSIMYSRLFGGEKSKVVLISAGIRVVTLLVLLFFLGKSFGLIGLGISTLISTTLELIVLLISSKIVYNKISGNKSGDAI